MWNRPAVGQAGWNWRDPIIALGVGVASGAAILVNGELAGRVTSVRYSPGTRKAVGLAWIPAELARDGAELGVRVAGRLARARVTRQAFYDPEGVRLRL